VGALDIGSVRFQRHRRIAFLAEVDVEKRQHVIPKGDEMSNFGLTEKEISEIKASLARREKTAMTEVTNTLTALNEMRDLIEQGKNLTTAYRMAAGSGQDAIDEWREAATVVLAKYPKGARIAAPGK
jgi:hypothetical protein